MKFMAVVMVICVLCFVGCGGDDKSSDSTEVTITVSPFAIALGQNQTATFTATVTNSSTTTVTWQVNGVDGGNSSVGTISSAGLYTSPTSITSQFTVTITAISQADTTKTATATISLNPPATPPKSPILISPSSAKLSAGAQQTFTASVSGASATVVWSVSCQSQNVADCGSITQDGVYTAPLFPPPGGSALITASASDSSALPGNSPALIQISNQSLFGQYAFAASGKNGSSTTAVAGSLTFDGQGNVTDGVEDIAGSAGSPLTVTGGSYHIGTDGRGSLTVQTSAGTQKWQLVMANHSRVLLTSFDASGAVNSGVMDLQKASELGAASFQGNYSMQFAGTSTAQPSGALRAIGAFTADGTSAISPGLMDVNDTGTAQTSLSLTGTFTAPSAQGRGELTLISSAGTNTYVYYQVDASHLKLFQTGSAVGTGELVKQTGSSFQTSTFNATYVTAIGGVDSHGPASTGGILVLNGQGGLKATIDTNSNGNTQLNQSVTGSYSVTDATTGRTTLTWTATDGTHQFVLYPTVNNDVNLLQVDSASASGPALYQPSAITNASLSGNFATQASGTDFTASVGPVAWSGTLIPNGGSAITAVLDLNNNGAVASAAGGNGSYSFDTNGRGTVTLTTGSSLLQNAHLAVYGADTNRAVYVGIDSNRVITGTMQKQY